MSNKKSKPVKQTEKPVSVETNNLLKEEILRWVLTILSSISVYIFVAQIIVKNYHPDIDALLKTAAELSFSGGARPEPVESLLFRSGIIIISLGLLGFYILFLKIQLVKNIAQSKVFDVIIVSLAVLVFILLYEGFAAPNPFAPGGAEQPQNSRDIEANTNFEFFFKGLFLDKYLLLYFFLLVPAIAFIFFIGFRKLKWQTKDIYVKYSMLLNYLFSGGIILAIFLMSTFKFPYTFQNKYNFNAAYYSMTQVYAGLPMLVDGFTNTYGLYPQFLYPVFKIIGLNVFKFSLIMSIMSSLCFLANFILLKQYVKNNIILLLGFSLVVFFPFLDFKFVTPFDTAFAFHAIRYIIPSTLAVFASLYFLKKSSLIYWITFLIIGCFVLWNPEVGMMCYLAWVVSIIYNDFYDSDKKIAFKKIIFHPLVAALNLIVIFYGYKFIIFLFYGSSPDYSLLFGHIVHFGKTGIGVLPMTLVHPWNISVLIIITGILYSITKLYKREISPKTSVIFLTSLIALGFLVYFQGRSHNWPYAVTSGFCIILLVILGDELWGIIKDRTASSIDAIFYLFLFIASFSFFEILYGTKKINEMIYQKTDKALQKEEENLINNNESFIVQNTQKHEKIFILTASYYPSYYFNGNERRSAFNPGEQDMIFHSQLKQFENTIIDSSFKVFIEPKLCNAPYLQRQLAAVAASYEINKANLSMLLLKKGTRKNPKKSFFNKKLQTIIYRKYSNDTSGIKNRVDDSQGISPANFPTEFSIEVLFYSQDQLYDYATIMGNMADTAGFMISKRAGTNKYFFGINGAGYEIALLNNSWIYLVMNVYSNHLEIFQNGDFITNIPLTSPYKTSKSKLFIGNLGYMRYYIGPISEIKIATKPLKPEEIKNTMIEISQEFKY